MEKFYLGMDVGTESVGMACTDEKYNLLRAKGKDLWCVRLFDEAQSAEDRRQKRTARRRMERRKQRIDFLQEIFAPFMSDNTFFIRLNNSGFHLDDKDSVLQSKYSLFADTDFNDVDYHKNYPTIFHLRKELSQNDGQGKKDLRLYYLALHHVIKYRGHFLWESGQVGDVGGGGNLFDNFNALAEELFSANEDSEVVVKLDKTVLPQYLELFASPIGQKDKKGKAEILFGANDKIQKKWANLLTGSSVGLSDLFGELVGEEDGKEKVDFGKMNDEKFAGLESACGDCFALLCAAREIYNYASFKKVLGNAESISDAMIEVYKKHKSDLKLLKDLVKKVGKKGDYYEIFRSTKLAKEKATNDEKGKEKDSAKLTNYVGYVGWTKNKNKIERVKKCKAEEFFAYLNKKLESYAGKVNDGGLIEKIRQEIKDGRFLPFILHSDNGVFPQQINYAELEKIVANLCKDYPEFSVKGEDGFSAAEKIKKTFLYRIPYFVGPLCKTHATEDKGAWVVRKDGKITPWNFDDMVDKAASNEKFMRRMTNKCTYMVGKDVLPKFSMYYQAFDVLNQINKLRFNGQPISVEQKQELFQNLFLTRKKVTLKAMKGYLVKTGKLTREEEKDFAITGVDEEIKASMSSYVTFKNQLGNFVDERPDVCENIILWHTLNTDKTIVEGLIKKNYGEIPVISQNLKWLKGLSAFKEFGRLSKELLFDLAGGQNDVTGEVYTILDCLYNTNYNFNELIFSKEYTFENQLKQQNQQKGTEVGIEDVNDLYVSPMVRRGIWQALCMTDEYVKAVGKAPDKIFVEVTREEQKDKKRTSSRKQQLTALLTEAQKTCDDVNELMKELNDTDDFQLRQERLYLYFKQLGRCMYSGERIELDELGTNRYDVDHIVPRSMTKDDSLENKVLVCRSCNSAKSDTYPIPTSLWQKDLWLRLKNKKLLSADKFARLTRTKELDESDFNDFINRQLVVTNQTAKAVAELLQRKYGQFGTKVVYSKAKNVSEFRAEYDIFKCRETNDLHHARDAYLNVVVGNVYDTKYSNVYFSGSNSWTKYSLKNLFKNTVNGAWEGDSTLAHVKNVVAKTSMMVTHYTTTGKGEFYNQTIYSQDDKGIAVPRKLSAPYCDTEKYGGYKSLNTAYFAIVSSKDAKGNEMKTIEAIPVLVDYQSRYDENAVIKHLLAIGLKEPQIIVPKIKIKTLLSINGYKVRIAGITGSRIILHNAQQWKTDAKTDRYVKQLDKLVQMEKDGKLQDKDLEKESFDMIKNKDGEITLTINREENLNVYKQVQDVLALPCYQGLSSVKSFAATLAEAKEKFQTISVLQQAKVLLQLARFMRCNAETADLKLVGKGAACGKILTNKKIAGVDVSIIHQSACGLQKKVVTL